jgi:uncharacterized membrane protein HdeD (DUF308 family)
LLILGASSYAARSLIMFVGVLMVLGGVLLGAAASTILHDVGTVHGTGWAIMVGALSPSSRAGWDASSTHAEASQPPDRKKRAAMIILGVVLLLLGLLTGIHLLWTIGVILVVVGAILWILGAAGREVGGRRHYY